jgi:hypothetical protein
VPLHAQTDQVVSIPQTLQIGGCTLEYKELQSPEAATPMHRYRRFNV